MLSGPWLLLLSLSLLPLFTSVRPHLVNITVDDQLGDPVTALLPEYSPDESWHRGSASENCSSCSIKPWMLDLSQIYKKTWTHGTFFEPPMTPPVITVSFNGSAVYIFNIIPNTLPPAFTLANISFSIDGETVGAFFHAPDASSTILYNQLVYSNESLNNGPHTLTMAPIGNNSLIIFDYLVYTTQSDDTTPTSSSINVHITSSSDTSTQTSNSTIIQSSTSHTPAPVSVIVGAVFGGIALLAVVIGGFLLHSRHARSRATASTIFHSKPTQCRSPTEDGRAERDRGHASPGLSPPRARESATPPSSSLIPEPISPCGATVPDTLLLPSDVSRYETERYPPTMGIVADISQDQLLVPPQRSLAWTSKRRAELTRRLEALNRTRSILSSGQTLSPGRRSHSEVSSASGAESHGTEAAMRALETEIAMLRGVLATMNIRFAEGHVGHMGDGDGEEPLPGYEE